MQPISNGPHIDLSTPDVCHRCFSEGRVAHSDIDLRFLSTSYVPNELEREDMKIAIEMEEVLVQKIGALHRSLKARIQQRRSAISLLRRTPVEIWENIFSLVCHGNSSYSFDTRHVGEPPTQSMMITPNVLASVCVHWQQIVHKTPRLWTSIRFDLGHLNLPRSPLPPLRTHLLRSNERPLDLYLSFRDDELNGPKKLCGYKDAVLAVVLPHIWRCRSWTLSLDRDESLGDLLSRSSPPVCLRFPYLQKLSVSSDSDRAGKSEHRFWNAISQAGSLTHLSTTMLTNIHSLPYRQLTSLSIDETLDARSLCPVLGACSSLQTLFLADFRPGIEWADPSSVVLPSLSELSLTIRVFPDDLLPLFTMATFPILRKLNLVCSGHSSPDLRAVFSSPDGWSPHLFPRVRRSATMLDNLSLTFNNVSIRDSFQLANLLNVTPQVSRLEITLLFDRLLDWVPKFVSSSLLRLLKVYPASKDEDGLVFLPGLTHLRIHDGSLKWCCRDCVSLAIGFANSRGIHSLVGNSVTPLQDFHFTYCDGLHGNGEVHCNDVAQYPVILHEVEQLATVHGIRCTLAHTAPGPSVEASRT